MTVYASLIMDSTIGATSNVEAKYMYLSNLNQAMEMKTISASVQSINFPLRYKENGAR